MGKRRRVTLQAVADNAGVNRVTAAAALGRSGQGGTRVSEATRLRILETAQRLGYPVDGVGTMARHARTNIIGFYSGYEPFDASSPFTAAILQGLQRACHAHNQDLMLFGSYERAAVDSIYAALIGGKIDGLVLLPTPLGPTMDRLIEPHLPVVGIANAHPAIPTVTVDDAAGSTLLAQYLAQKGHRHILYRSHRDRRISAVRRQEAFLAAASDLGMSVMVTYERGIHELSALETTLLAEPQNRRPTAAACWMDLNAYALIRHSERLGLRVPEDLAVVGFDGVPLQLEPKRALTTIRAPWPDVAAHAVQQLLALLDGDELPRETMLPVELVHGDTA